ncbi:bifunctional nicotinamidase/pyrazinamidase [Methylobacterium terricola]|uniref:Nicotinamidase n=1 Tax=Methylobacterium terricola TaxID=2583531 RepID=A0A5C4L9E7_9HYPH|nr:bifunctional nicotinamidase/pyrazinamidase [Methylobacterium terricola]TNC08414.1 bifunctional nicotinamidase/pyrazinamidase [Methylobacterium terricola]
MASCALTANETDCLLVIDVQADFLPGGALAVPDGDAVIAPINALGKTFQHVVLTQDWHPAGHASFAASHAGKAPFETTILDYGPQVLWPEHCVQGTPGAELSPHLALPHAQLVIRKGYRPGIDSYSAFREADRKTSTGLAGYLRERGFTRVFLCGLATDYCVAWSAIDAREAGFEAVVVEDACRAIDRDGSLERAWADMAAAGVEREESGTIGG